MTKQGLAAAYTRLRSMNAAHDQEWNDDRRENYALVLAPLDDELGLETVKYAVLNEEWRPSPARLREIAAIVASPIPDSEQAYAEIMYKAQMIGAHGTPDPDNPNVFLTGSPPMSHPIVSQIVAYCGGWELFCSGEANLSEGLKKQVRSAHESVARQWRQEVSRQLTMPAEQRNPVYLRRYEDFRLPGWYVPGVTGSEEQIPPRLPDPDVKTLPPEIREQVRKTTASLPSLEPRRQRESVRPEHKPPLLSVPPMYRRAIEAEVKDKSAEAEEKAKDPEYVRRRIEELTKEPPR